MGSTVQISDELYREVEATAVLSGRSVATIVEQSLRQFLAEQKMPGQLTAFPISTSQGGFTDEFMATGIDFSNTSEVLHWLDEVEGRFT